MGRRLGLLGSLLLIVCAGVARASFAAPEEKKSASVSTVTASDFAEHVTALEELVKACEAARNEQACDVSKVGADENVLFANDEVRTVRYTWLRNVIEKAQKPDAPVANAKAKDAEAKKKDAEKKQDDDEDDDDDSPTASLHQMVEKSGRAEELTTGELLKRAEARLEQERAAAEKLNDASADVADLNAAKKESAHAHEVLKQVLSQSKYAGLNKVEPKNTFWEKLNNWLNNLLTGVADFGSKAPWIGKLLVALLIVALLVVVIVLVMRGDRRMRLRFVPESPGAHKTASARDWQLWLKDAEEAAARGEWREAIHFVYWASISRLESMRLWPADRTRTPREYLALVKQDNPRKEDLRTLTRSFERTWYGGREADANDYAQATAIAERLIAAGGAR